MTYPHKILHNLTDTCSNDSLMSSERGDAMMEPQTLMQHILHRVKGRSDAEEMIAIANDLYGGERGSETCTWREGFKAYRLVLLRKIELEVHASSIDRRVIGDATDLTERELIVNQLTQELDEFFGVSNYGASNNIKYEDHEVIIENDMNRNETRCHQEPLRKRFDACGDSNEVLTYFGRSEF